MTFRYTYYVRWYCYYRTDNPNSPGFCKFLCKKQQVAHAMRTCTFAVIIIIHFFCYVFTIHELFQNKLQTNTTCEAESVIPGAQRQRIRNRSGKPHRNIRYQAFLSNSTLHVECVILHMLTDCVDDSINVFRQTLWQYRDDLLKHNYFIH